MKALRFDGSLRLVDDAPVPRREGEALVEVICAGICNTDLEIVKGYAGFRGTLGHEFVGRVVESSDATLVGRRVVGEINVGCGSCALCRAGDARHCVARTVLGIHGRDGAFAEYLSLPTRNLFEVPDSIDDEEAVFVEPLAAALNIFEQVDIDKATTVAIVGDGKLAQLIVRVMALTGCSLTIIGKHAEKLELAKVTGARRFKLQRDDRIVSIERNGGSIADEKFDVVIETSGSPSGLRLAMNLVRPRGTIVLKSTHHEATPVDLSQVVVNEVKLAGSRCGRFHPAIDLLASRTIDVGPLISERMSLTNGVAAFERAASPSTMKVLMWAK
ncbi:MAG TPA: alcohol dehydrogenase catalytic domain-containing protein [Blastocatellia bacterium]|nr:alcohol dehydrogenase catalytic domain-containing protein [Blastocatellia bacterium]